MMDAMPLTTSLPRRPIEAPDGRLRRLESAAPRKRRPSSGGKSADSIIRWLERPARQLGNRQARGRCYRLRQAGVPSPATERATPWLESRAGSQPSAAARFGASAARLWSLESGGCRLAAAGTTGKEQHRIARPRKELQ